MSLWELSYVFMGIVEYVFIGIELCLYRNSVMFSQEYWNMFTEILEKICRKKSFKNVHAYFCISKKKIN